MSEDEIYQRWDHIQDLFGRLDTELVYASIEGAEIKHGAVEVTFTRLTAQGDHERITRSYRFAQRPVSE